jgi:hypothetical protein
MIMNYKRFGRNRSWTNFKALSRRSPRQTEENHEKPRKTSFRIANLRAEIWTRDLPNTKQNSITTFGGGEEV